MPPRETDRMRNRISKYFETSDIPSTACGTRTDLPQYTTPDDLRTQRILGYYQSVPEPAYDAWVVVGKWFMLISATVGWITMAQRIIMWIV